MPKVSDNTPNENRTEAQQACQKAFIRPKKLKAEEDGSDHNRENDISPHL